MAVSLSRALMGRVRLGLGAMALGAATISLSGCKLMDPMPVAATPAVAGAAAPTTPIPAAAPQGPAADLYTYWEKTLQMAPDPLRNFQMAPCVVGRMTLLGTKHTPVICDGEVIVSLYDERPAHGGNAVMLEQWRIDKDNLRKMIGMDPLHMWGYTLALPTATCNPSITHVRLEVQFKAAEPKEATPLFAAASSVRLDYNDVLQKQGATLAANYRQGQPAAGGPGAGVMPTANPQQFGQQPMMGQQQFPQQPMMGQQQFPQQPMMMPQQAPQSMAPAQQSMLAPRVPASMVAPAQQSMPAPVQQPLMVPQQQPLMVPQQQPLMVPQQQPLMLPQQEPMLAPVQQPTLAPQTSMAPSLMPVGYQQMPQGPVQPLNATAGAPAAQLGMPVKPDVSGSQLMPPQPPRQNVFFGAEVQR
ncbi:MAG TPA: hypothetical protein VE988_02125 [Gemmataceae bacterium]|nr:hypothetical protein [Gemmataceae bacterium]